MLATGFLMTRLTGLLRLPNVTAYILAGVLGARGNSLAAFLSAPVTFALLIVVLLVIRQKQKEAGE